MSANATLSSPSRQHKAIHIAVVVDIAQYCFVSDAVLCSLFGLTSGARRHRRRSPRLGRSPMFWGLLHSGRKHIRRCSWVGLRPATRSTTPYAALASPLIDIPQTCYPRRVRSDSRARRQERDLAMFPAVSFLCLELFGERAVAYFSCTKLGRQLTAL